MVSCENCQHERERIRRILVDFESLQADLIAKNRRIKALEDRLDKERKQDPMMDQARDVFEAWAATQKKPERCLFTSDRQRLLLARLHEGHTVEELKEAIDGAAVGAFEKNGVRYDGIQTIFKGGESVMRHRRLAQANKLDGSNLEPSEVVKRIAAISGEPTYDLAHGWYEFACPLCDHGTLNLTVEEDGMSMICFECGAEEQRLRAFVAKRGART